MYTPHTIQQIKMKFLQNVKEGASLEEGKILRIEPQASSMPTEQQVLQH